MSDQIIIQHEGKDVDGFETMTVKADMTQQDYASTGQALFEMMQKRAHFSGEKKEASEKVNEQAMTDDEMQPELFQ
jgi:hypothetical protein